VAEDGRAGDEDFCAGRGDRRDVVAADAAVDLDADVEVPLPNRPAQASNLFN
jgi:hypothetical protein